MEEVLSETERRQVENHRGRLSRELGYEVSYDLALLDWMDNHAPRWRQERHRQLCAMQREEIERHKWIESEKAQRDLGTQAKLDWIHRYAASWREWYETRFDGGEV